MVDIGTKLTGDALPGLDKLEESIKQQVLRAGAAKMGEVMYDEVKLNTSGAKMGGAGDPPGVKTGTLNKSVYRAYSPEKSDDETKTYHVSFNKRKAPHGLLLERGTSKMLARPFIRPALSRLKAAIEAGKTRMAEKLKSLR